MDFVPKEKEIRRRLLEEFRKLYGEAGHCLPIETWTQSGVPDCYLMLNGRVVWLEVKRLYTKPTPIQQAWHAACTKAGGRVAVLTARQNYVLLQARVGDGYVEMNRFTYPVKWQNIIYELMR